MQWALSPLQWLGTWSHRTLGQLRLDNAGQVLKVIVAWVAEVGGPKAEIDGHRAAITTLVLQEISAMFGTNLNKSLLQSSDKNYRRYSTYLNYSHYQIHPQTNVIRCT